MSNISINDLRVWDDTLQNTRKTGTSQLGKTEFLQLLVAQMANQDPLSPSDDTQFIAQLAQFSALEQMQALNSTAVSSQAYSLVGKYVYAVKVIDGQEVLNQGIVNGVVTMDGIPYVVIGEESYLVSEVVGVSDMTEQSAVVTAHAHILGKQVTATLDVEDAGDDTGATQPLTREVTGTATQITLKEGVITVTIEKADGSFEDVPLSSITRIGLTEITEPPTDGPTAETLLQLIYNSISANVADVADEEPAGDADGGKVEGVTDSPADGSADDNNGTLTEE